MKYARQYIQSAAAICDVYDGSVPLAAFLKQYFSQNKKFGSKDRKHISHVCYSYYRLGNAVKNIPFEEHAKLALFLCQRQPGEWELLFERDWIENWEPVLHLRLQFAQNKIASFSIHDIFPWQKQLDIASIEYDAFCSSHLIQPDLFLRLRPGKTSTVRRKLDTAGIAYETINENCIALVNGTRIDEIITLDAEAVVQDASSQRIAELLQKIPQEKQLLVWDCCAASGGKSILAYDTLHPVSLTVSDIRESIIQNLRKRFERAGVKAHKIFTADISKPEPGASPKYDLVICDVPCTGSGTWGRTPEQLFFFREEKINHYSSLQQKIVANVLPFIKPGGYLLYSTCSVFTKENQEIVKSLPDYMELIQMEPLNGYDKKADSMFAALLKKK